MTKYKQITRMILDIDPSISHEKAASAAYAASYASYASYTAYAAYVAVTSYASYAYASYASASAYASAASAAYAIDRELLEKLFKALVFNDLSSQQLKNEVLKYG